MLQPDRQRHERPKRRSTETRVARIRESSILTVDEGFDLLDQHSAVELRVPAAIPRRIARWRVLVRPLCTIVWNSHEDDRLDVAALDHRTRGSVNSPAAP